MVYFGYCLVSRALHQDILWYTFFLTRKYIHTCTHIHSHTHTQTHLHFEQYKTSQFNILNSFPLFCWNDLFWNLFLTTVPWLFQVPCEFLLEKKNDFLPFSVICIVYSPLLYPCCILEIHGQNYSSEYPLDFIAFNLTSCNLWNLWVTFTSACWNFINENISSCKVHPHKYWWWNFSKKTLRDLHVHE